jgi:hypothetical protein
MQGFAEFRINPILCPATDRSGASGADAASAGCEAPVLPTFRTTTASARWIQEHPAWI